MLRNGDGLAQPPGGIRRVAIDLTPVRPGGENGGAKLVALELVRRFAEAHPEVQFTLLTAVWSHAELAPLERENVVRRCVTGVEAGQTSAGLPAKFRAKRTAARVLPERLKAWLSQWMKPPVAPPPSPLVEALGAQLLFCPFTAPLNSSTTAVTVSVVHDLQYRTYPQFFSAEDREERDRHFQWACRAASRIVCPSEYVRETVIRNGRLDPDRVIAIANTLQSRFSKWSGDEVRRRLDPLNIEPDGYLLYPANFWHHKNHEMLLVAFGMFRSANPQGKLKLVLTGAPGKREDEIRKTVQRLGLQDRVAMPGFVSEADYAAILQGSLALVFPSLYEGFGMPVLEAMAMGKAVLCSDRTSLPEVAGNAAEYFDPRSPHSIAAAIERIVNDPERLKRRGQEAAARAAMFGDGASMARKYWDVFESCLAVESRVGAGV